MTVQVKLPTVESLQIQQVKPGLWKVKGGDKTQAYDFFEVPAVFQRQPADRSSSDSVVAKKQS